MEEVFFIDSEGRKISKEKISSHIGLANAILNENEHLKESFQKSGKQDPVDFLLYDVGYAKFTQQSYYRKCVCYSPKISLAQKRVIAYYCYEEGYKLDDLSKIGKSSPRNSER